MPSQLWEFPPSPASPSALHLRRNAKVGLQERQDGKVSFKKTAPLIRRAAFTQAFAQWCKSPCLSKEVRGEEEGGVPRANLS